MSSKWGGISNSFPIYVLFIHIISSWVVYFFGVAACKILIQIPGFTLPLIMSVPLTMMLLFFGCNSYQLDTCVFQNYFPPYTFWSCSKFDLDDWETLLNISLWLFCFLFQIWINFHIFKPNCTKCDKVSSQENLFVKPMYSSILLDQSLILNR